MRLEKCKQGGFLNGRIGLVLLPESPLLCNTVRFSLLRSVAHEKDGFEEGFGMVRPD